MGVVIVGGREGGSGGRVETVSLGVGECFPSW